MSPAATSPQGRPPWSLLAMSLHPADDVPINDTLRRVPRCAPLWIVTFETRIAEMPIPLGERQGCTDRMGFNLLSRRLYIPPPARAGGYGCRQRPVQKECFDKFASCTTQHWQLTKRPTKSIHARAMSIMPKLSKRNIVQVRLSQDDKARVEAAAAHEHARVSAWLRHIIRRTLDADTRA